MRRVESIHLWSLQMLDLTLDFTFSELSKYSSETRRINKAYLVFSCLRSHLEELGLGFK